MSTISESYAAAVTASMNNWPLAMSTGLDPTVGPVGLPTDPANRINMVTFETLAKNINSYPRRSDIRNPELITTTYYLDGTKTNTIVKTIDTTTPNCIKVTLTGNTGYDGILTKRKAWIDDVLIDAVYSLE